MKSLVVIIVSLFLVNCSNKKFTADDQQQLIDLIEDQFTVDDPIDDENPIDDEDPVDDEDPTQPDPYCPRYDLVIKSSHVSTKRLTYKMTYNAEMNHTSTQGEIGVQFLEDGAKKFTQCSGSYTNTVHAPTLKPLKALEALTREIMLNHSTSCTTVMPTRLTSLQVIDAANGKVLWDEQKLRQRFGECVYGYTAEGAALRASLIDLADKVTKDMADQCQAQ